MFASLAAGAVAAVVAGASDAALGVKDGFAAVSAGAASAGTGAGGDAAGGVAGVVLPDSAGPAAGAGVAASTAAGSANAGTTAEGANKFMVIANGTIAARAPKVFISDGSDRIKCTTGLKTRPTCVGNVAL